jgi:hypothetical protein
VNWLQESLFSITRDGTGRAEEFFRLWAIITVELQLAGLHTEGHPMVLAAEAVGWRPAKGQAITQLEEVHSHAFHHVKSLAYIPLARASKLRKLASPRLLLRYAMRGLRFARFSWRRWRNSGWSVNPALGGSQAVPSGYNPQGRQVTAG